MGYMESKYQTEVMDMPQPEMSDKTDESFEGIQPEAPEWAVDKLYDQQAKLTAKDAEIEKLKDCVRELNAAAEEIPCMCTEDGNGGRDICIQCYMVDVSKHCLKELGE